MTRLRITGVVATTRPMKAYGGVRISRDMVMALATKLQTGEIPFGLHHNPRINIDAVVVDVTTRQDADGETLAEITLEVDENEYNQKGGMDVNGFSFQATVPLVESEESEPLVTISADAHWYSDIELQAAAEVFANQGVVVQANRLYQFGDVPTALVLLNFVGQQVAAMPTAVLCNYIYDSLKNFLTQRKVIQNEPGPSDFAISFDPETGRVTKAHIRTSSEAVLKRAMDKLPEIINANVNGAHEFPEAEQSWRRVD